MVQGYKGPGVRDYDNLWDGVIDATYWTTTGTVTELNGGLKIASDGGTGDGTATTTINLLSVYKLNCALSMYSQSWGGNGNGTTTVKLTLTDGGANTYDIVSLYTTAAGGGTSNRAVASTAAGGLFSFITEGSKVRFYHNAAAQTFNDAYGSGSSTVTGTVQTSNTLVDTSTWSNVYLKISVVAVTGGVGVARGQATISAVELVPFFLSSQGTQ